jgi:hypothetical protein
MNFQRPFKLAFAAALTLSATALLAQAPSHLGPVTAVNVGGLTINDSKTNTPVSVTVSGTTKVLVVAPGSTDLKSATPGSLADVAVGDKALVTGTAGDPADSLTAVRVILMKATAIAQSHQAEEAAWAQGSGGIVKSVDPAAGTVVISSGMKSITVSTTPHTIVRHYSGDSVRFEDAVLTKLSEIKPGDQLRVRGTKSADGASIAADEIVAGSFHNYSGLIASIDAASNTITLKDLASKKTVSVAVTPNSDIHRIPLQMATMLAARMKGTPAPTPGTGPGANPGGPAGPRPAGAYNGQRAGADLSQMLARLPTETLGGLKVGDAVMIVATSPVADSSKSSAVTLLAGVDPILTASPTGEMTLSPWSVGSGAPDMSGGPQ